MTYGGRGGGFLFPINFDWSQAGASTRQFFANLQADIERILATTRAGSASQTRGFVDLEAQLDKYFNTRIARATSPARVQALESIRGAVILDPNQAKPGERVIQNSDELREVYGAQIIQARNSAAAQAVVTQSLVEEADVQQQAAGLAAEQVHTAQLRGAAARQALEGENELVGVKAEQINAEAQLLAATRLEAQESVTAAELQQRAAGANAAATTAAQQRAIAARQSLQLDNNLIQAKADELADTRLLRAAVHREALEVLRARAARVGTPGEQSGDYQAALAFQGTRFQQAQARIATRTSGLPRLPSEFQTLGQFVSAKLLTTAGFALSGALFYGVFQGARNAFQESQALERELSLVREQLRQAGNENQFNDIRDSIFDTARSTGILTSDIAHLALQLRGAFNEEIQQRGIGFFKTQLEDAAKIARVTELPLNEITDSLTGLTKTFGVSFKEIGDTTVGLQQRFGVLARETIEFTADLGPAAKEAGATFQQIAALGAAVQRVSGRSGSSLAEAIGRILPQIQDSAVEIVQTIQQINDPKLLNQITTDLANGRTFDVLVSLIRVFDRLNQSQKVSITEALGGRRESQTLSALFGDAKAVIKELDNIGKNQDAGRLNKQFEALQGTMKQTFAELRQAALQLGTILIESGIAQSITEIARSIKTLLEVITAVLSPLRIFADLMTKVGGGQGAGGDIFGSLVSIGAIAGLSRFIGNRRGGPGIPRGSDPFAGPPIFTPNVGTSASNLGASQARVLATRMGDAVKRYTSSFFQTLSSPQGRAGAAGIAAVVTGQLVGGDLGDGLTAAGTGLSLGALGVHPAIAAAIGLTTYLSNYLEQGKQLAQQQDALRQKLAEYNDSKLLDLANRDVGKPYTSRRIPVLGPIGTKVLDVGSKIFGGPGLASSKPEGYTALEVFQQRYADDYRHGLQLFLKQLDPRNELAKRILQALRETRGKDPEAQFKELGGLINEIYRGIGDGTIKGLRVLQNATQAGKPLTTKETGTIVKTIQQQQQSFEAGTTSYAEYEKALTDAQQAALLTITKSPGGKAPETVTKLYVDATTRLSKLRSDFIKDQVDQTLQIFRLRGQPVGIADLSVAIDALQNTKVTDPDVRADLIKTAFDTLGAILDQNISAATTAAEKARIALEGIKVPKALEVAQVAQQVEAALNTSAAARNDLIVLANLIGQQGFQGLINAIAEEIVNTGATIAGASKTVISKMIADLEGFINTVSDADAIYLQFVGQAATELDRLKALRDSLSTDPNLDRPALQVGTITRDATDYLQQSAEDAKRAAEEAERLQERIDEARNKLIEAQLDYLKTLSRDPVQQAQIDVQIADVHAFMAGIAASRAKDEADLLQAQADAISAQAERVQAERALQDALYDIFKAQHDLVMAIAEAAGDTIEVARIQLQQAEADLFVAGLGGAGQAEILNLQAEVVRRQAALRDAQLADREATIDFNLQVKKISSAQAIAQYQALLDSADILHLTEQEKRDLILKIRQLRQDLNRDLQFDLPSELRLPTLYEVRRLNQSGGNYQDNRVVNITLNANGSLDAQAAVNRIVDEVNAPSVYGSKPRRY